MNVALEPPRSGVAGSWFRTTAFYGGQSQNMRFAKFCFSLTVTPVVTLYTAADRLQMSAFNLSIGVDEEASTAMCLDHTVA